MKTFEDIQFHIYCDRLAERVQQLKEYDLSDDADRARALEESRQLLGAVAHCRHLLKQIEAGHEALELQLA